MSETKLSYGEFEAKKEEQLEERAKEARLETLRRVSRRRLGVDVFLIKEVNAPTAMTGNNPPVMVLKIETYMYYVSFCGHS